MNKNKEDYIKAIYELGGEKKTISNKEISRSLGVSPPSVSEMIKKLVDGNYISYQEYKGVRLRKKGVEAGRNIRKKHLLWEVFLVDKLGYDWEKVHKVAEDLEHFTDDLLRDRLEVFLEYPKACPHGNPIDAIPREKTSNLLNYKKGKFRISRIKDDKKVLEFATRENIKLGDWLEIISSLEDTYRVKLNGVEKIIGNTILEKIFVEEEVE